MSPASQRGVPSRSLTVPRASGKRVSGITKSAIALFFWRDGTNGRAQRGATVGCAVHLGSPGHWYTRLLPCSSTIRGTAAGAVARPAQTAPSRPASSNMRATITRLIEADDVAAVFIDGAPTRNPPLGPLAASGSQRQLQPARPPAAAAIAACPFLLGSSSSDRPHLCPC
jgi:hypothetical protein